MPELCGRWPLVVHVGGLHLLVWLSWHVGMLAGWHLFRFQLTTFAECFATFPHGTIGIVVIGQSCVGVAMVCFSQQCTLRASAQGLNSHSVVV